MFCTDIPAPFFLVFSNSVPALLYYSHIPTAIISLFMGFFVFYKNKTFAGKLLFSISILFFLWSLLSLIVWTNIDSKIIMFSWSFFGILYDLIYIISIYFVYVFINKKDVSTIIKSVLIFLFLPVIILTATKYNLNSFSLNNCEAQENIYFTNYYYILGFAIFLWILIYGIYKYIKEKTEFRKQILYLVIGIELFLFSFFITGFLASYLVEKGIIEDFGLEQYGLFGMTFFMGMLAYMIVKFKAFNIKLIGAQALVYTLVILIGSQFFFIQNNINRILTGITLALSIVFGIFLVKSIKNEVRRKEELQMMTNKLAIANDQLRKLDNAKSEFISIASHQLRTPLTAIKGFISLLLEGSYGPVNQPIKDVLNKIYISNERLVDLVEDMLNLSRIESGRMEYKFEKVDLPALCQEIYDTFILRAKGKGLKLELDLPKEKNLEVFTDRNKIREVISNLVDNALKYTNKGWVRIKLSPIEDGTRIAIIDTGIGVPQEEIPYLFSKFSRGKNVSRLNATGTGLGLHIGKKMIEALHGKIWVESRGAEMGSTFFIEMPKKVEEK
jgi:signal transduction histidine kinase